MTDADLCFLTASQLARRVAQRELSARDVVGAHLARIEQINPRVNAIVTLTADQALAAAARADDHQRGGENEASEGQTPEVDEVDVEGAPGGGGIDHETTHERNHAGGDERTTQGDQRSGKLPGSGSLGRRRAHCPTLIWPFR